MTPPRAEEVKALRQRLVRLREGHEDHWTFGGPRRHNARALFQYPAMMVADMQRDLTEALLAHRPKATGPSFDPFVGSGTVLGASMELGRDFVGWDINPLAILICKVKAGPLHLAAFEDAVERVLGAKRAPGPEVRFDNWAHWFTHEVACQLTTLRGAIRAENNAATRRFLWLCLAETVRLTSNSRTTTVKLHRRPQEQIDNRPAPLDVFARVARQNLVRLAHSREELVARGVMRGGRYRGDVQLELGDSRKLGWSGAGAACLVTSPPYGDNTSTVPYGQHAYLPLQWIDLFDIDADADTECLRSTYEIDSRSLGGSKLVKPEESELLRTRSKAIVPVLDKLADLPRDRSNRVVAFLRDFNEALTNTLSVLDDAGVTAWTVGSRRVGGLPIPFEQVLVELAGHQGFEHVETLHRDIPGHHKRMASRNRTGATMSREHVVVLRRAQ